MREVGEGKILNGGEISGNMPNGFEYSYRWGNCTVNLLLFKKYFLATELAKWWFFL